MPCATPARSSACGGAGARDFDDVNVEGTRHVIEACRARRASPGSSTPRRSWRCPRPGTRRPLAAQRLPAHQSRRRSAVVRDAVRTGAPIVLARSPAWSTGRGRRPRATSSRACSATTSPARLPGIVGADRHLVVRVGRRRGGGARDGASERGTTGAEYAIGGENAAADADLRGRQDRSPAARCPAGCRSRWCGSPAPPRSSGPGSAGRRRS